MRRRPAGFSIGFLFVTAIAVAEAFSAAAMGIAQEQYNVAPASLNGA